MITDTLITPTQLRTYRPHAVIDDDRINPFIIEAQQNDLRPALNDALYYDLMNNFTDEEHAMYDAYQDLIDGVEYTYNAQTVYFSGIKPMLAYFTLARFIVSNQVNITRFGVTQKLNTQSEPTSFQMIHAEAKQMKSTAVNYQNELIRFLKTNHTDYPLYNTGGASSNISSRTSFKIFKL
jgi:hypothetical protein